MTNLKQQVKGLFRQVTPFVIGLVLLAGVLSYLKNNGDVHWFAFTHPDQVRQAMAVNRLGDMQKQGFINKVYGETFNSPVSQ